ncbi:septal ring lytic transglycosylase RlpA family protein [Terriglobus saanensis]|uniref:Probable endolytic peptidoglycan transglycosylase RlpA n=1 Tax=Terriglobus saanensis (strain ATCC BAA-1853 / DSM 23119 / SP1PR4) TaxID=401053 RepID=E8V6L0_TERSS|nr:septal ring lytic transglycosylase RlpA family protein [Terriglobus saanensis]ADV82749.1 rare lipoprotein A [Terriglobus saanensis SP1PR4]
MQRFFTPAGKRYVTVVLALAGVGAVGASVRAVHVHALTPTSQSTKTIARITPVPVVLKPVAEVKVGPAEVGKASWYGEELQGHLTANGERFDMNTLTCAHRTLPLGSLLRVTNLRNHRAVLVRVNDRGPVPEDRLLDLSRAAAQRIGLGGLARVRIERVFFRNHQEARDLVAQQTLIAKNNPAAAFPFLKK